VAPWNLCTGKIRQRRRMLVGFGGCMSGSFSTQLSGSPLLFIPHFVSKKKVHACGVPHRGNLCRARSAHHHHHNFLSLLFIFFFTFGLGIASTRTRHLSRHRRSVSIP
jgi:hypothetical protein